MRRGQSSPPCRRRRWRGDEHEEITALAGHEEESGAPPRAGECLPRFLARRQVPHGSPIRAVGRGAGCHSVGAGGNEVQLRRPTRGALPRTTASENLAQRKNRPELRRRTGRPFGPFLDETLAEESASVAQVSSTPSPMSSNGLMRLRRMVRWMRSDRAALAEGIVIHIDILVVYFRSTLYVQFDRPRGDGSAAIFRSQMCMWELHRAMWLLERSGTGWCFGFSHSTAGCSS